MGNSDYMEGRVIRVLRDALIHFIGNIKTNRPAWVVPGVSTGNSKSPSNQILAVPAWGLLGYSTNPHQLDVSGEVSVFGAELPDDVRTKLLHFLQSVAFVLCSGNIVVSEQPEGEGNGFFRNSPSDAIPKLGTTAIIAVAARPLLDQSQYIVSTLGHEIRHALDSQDEDFRKNMAGYVSHGENAQRYYSNPLEIRARVTEILHDAEDTVESLVEMIHNPASDAYAKNSLSALSIILGKGPAVFSAWAYGSLHPFFHDTSALPGIPYLPEPTTDRRLRQMIVMLTAQAYDKRNTSSQDRKKQQTVQDWMGRQSLAVYEYLISKYGKDARIPSGTFNRDPATEKTYVDYALANIRYVRSNLSNLQW